MSRIIDYLLQEWKLVLATCVVLAVAGCLMLQRLDIEAYPDPAPPLIEVLAQNPSWSAEEMEQQICVPLETQLNGMMGLEHMRSANLAGLTDIKCYFAYSTSYDADRQEVLNRINQVQLPAGVQAQLSPESTIGEIYRYQLVGPAFSLMDLKVTEDWEIERRFKQVPGVIDVSSFGGPTREFHVDLDPGKLLDFHVTLPQVMSALANANSNVGANYLDLGSQSYNIRGLGLFRTTADIGATVVAEKNGVPVLVRQLGTVAVGGKVPLGRVGRDDTEDIVQGVVLMRPGGQSLPTLRGVEAMARRLNDQILPKGMKIVPYYDRTDLVDVTTHTVRHTLEMGMLLVTFILLAFLGNLRAALIVAFTIPLSLCFVFVIMVWLGQSANLISLGAIDFGIIVDASVVMVENIFRHLSDQSRIQKVRLVASEGAREVAGPILFSTLVIFISFIPLFTMQGVEGKIFGPMALTYALALAGALLLSFSFSPAAAALLLKVGDHGETFLVRLLRRPYSVLLRWSLDLPWAVVGLAVVGLGITACAIPSLGGEFMPKLEEGNLWVRASMPTSISYTYASQMANQMRHVFRAYPEVITVVSQLGRSDDGTDTATFNNCEFFVPLTPRETWPDNLSKADLINRMDAELSRTFPGIDFNFSQNIEDNVEEAMSGVKGENSLKIFGHDLKTLETLADRVEEVMKDVPGVKDLGVFHELGQPTLTISTDREAAARYGVQVNDVNTMVSAAIGGAAATQVLDGDRRFDVVLRFLPDYRTTPASVGSIPVGTADGGMVPLRQLARIESTSGATFIYREDNERYIPIKFSVRDRDLQSTIDDAEARLAQRISFPAGYYKVWTGEFQELQDALDRLKVVIPVTLLIILFLLTKTFNNLVDALIILATVPLASIGGILALLATGTSFSISAAVGFISLFGVCVLQGVLLVSRIKQLMAEGETARVAIQTGSELQLRPVLMVALSAAIGLLPASVATSIGSETQRPLARVVVGGMITSIFVILLVLPAIYRLRYRQSLSHPEDGP